MVEKMENLRWNITLLLVARAVVRCVCAANGSGSVVVADDLNLKSWCACSQLAHEDVAYTYDEQLTREWLGQSDLPLARWRRSDLTRHCVLVRFIEGLKWYRTS